MTPPLQVVRCVSGCGLKIKLYNAMYALTVCLLLHIIQALNGLPMIFALKDPRYDMCFWSTRKLHQMHTLKL